MKTEMDENGRRFEIRTRAEAKQHLRARKLLMRIAPHYYCENSNCGSCDDAAGILTQWARDEAKRIK